MNVWLFGASIYLLLYSLVNKRKEIHFYSAVEPCGQRQRFHLPNTAPFSPPLEFSIYIFCELIFLCARFSFFSDSVLQKTSEEKNTFMLYRKNCDRFSRPSELWLWSYFSFILIISPTLQRLAEVHVNHTLHLYSYLQAWRQLKHKPCGGFSVLLVFSWHSTPFFFFLSFLHVS